MGKQKPSFLADYEDSFLRQVKKTIAFPTSPVQRKTLRDSLGQAQKTGNPWEAVKQRPNLSRDEYERLFVGSFSSGRVDETEVMKNLHKDVIETEAYHTYQSFFNYFWYWVRTGMKNAYPFVSNHTYNQCLQQFGSNHIPSSPMKGAILNTYINIAKDDLYDAGMNINDPFGEMAHPDLIPRNPFEMPREVLVNWKNPKFQAWIIAHLPEKNLLNNPFDLDKIDMSQEVGITWNMSKGKSLTGRRASMMIQDDIMDHQIDIWKYLTQNGKP